ncbi:hypothetical protein NW762_010878 [Fusarium torreyae]|uniref:Saccharopine dehydrogenase n=1 Tax=Fusarium torreyae TaxID=1237075 RepID=A0A9W8RSP5_9HYPO|nr:hypothetical protein NW762_010878 [Fusarium torreyae]
MAKESGAIIIPQTGSGSVPADLTVYLLASHIRDSLGAGTRQVLSASELAVQPAAGSLDAALSEFDIYSCSQTAKCRKPFALSPVAHVPLARPSHRSSWTSFFGIGYDQQLGALTDFEQSAIDVPLVERSWGLLDDGQFYGPNFQYEELKPVASSWAAFTGHLQAIAPTAEENPDTQSSKSEFYRNTAIAIVDTPDHQRVVAKSGFDGSIYLLTGICLAEAALTLLRGGETHASKFGGGFLTSATLGTAYIERLRNVGVRFDIY